MSLEIHNHRDLDRCPFCEHMLDGLEWLKTKTNIIDGGSKKDKVIVFSYCPKCFEISWRHYHKDTTQHIIDIMEMEMIVNDRV